MPANEGGSNDAAATDLDAERVGRWLGRSLQVEGRASTGSSNVTWLVLIDGAPAVLRHPPFGRRLPTAHDLAREHAYIKALDGTAVPVPAVIAFCDDPEVIGAPFLVTSRMGGTCLLAAEARLSAPRLLARSAIDTLATIHSIDWRGSGLPTPSGRYLVRQIRRWSEQLAKTPTASRLGDLSPIRDWLVAHLPPDEETTIVHGDYGFHNLLVDPQRCLVTAVLDWELATLGDPLSDLVSFVKGWGADAAPPNPANRSFSADGWEPERSELVAWYESSTGRSLEAHQMFYELFGRWRSIGIMEGIFARSGGTRFVDDVPRLVRRTMAMIEPV